MILTKINNELIQIYEGYEPEHEFLISSSPTNFSLGMIRDTEKILKDEKSKFYIKKIEGVKSSIVPFYVGIKLNKTKTNIRPSDQTGVFKITFSDNSIMVFGTWFYGYKMEIKHLAVAEKTTWWKYYKAIQEIQTKIDFPGKGVYSAFMFNLGGFDKLVYKKNEKNSFYYGDVVHHNKMDLEHEIDYFFENPKDFLRYGSPGVRKIMLIGEPGTGKTSLCYNIALRWGEKMNVSYVGEAKSLIRNAQILARADEPGIMIVEDCEDILANAGGPMLNFMSGLNQKRHKKGMLLLMTTNHPDQIDDRILKRPGRVDRVFEIGALNSSEAAICAQIYFGKRVIKDPKKGNWGVIFGNLTGSQIKELAHSAKMKAAAERKPLNEEFIKQIIVDMKEHYDKIREYSKKSSKVLKRSSKSVGYLATQGDNNSLKELFL